MDDVRALRDWLPGKTREEREQIAEDMYGHLSEFCHPNVGAFNQYCLFEERGGDFFMSIRAAPTSEPPHREAALTIGIALVAAEGLLSIYGRHPAIESEIGSIADSLAGIG